MKELVVISANGPDHWKTCCNSWMGKAPFTLLDTGSGEIPYADENVGPVWQTGAFLHAYHETDADAFLFTQDTVTVQPDWPDPVEWFRMRMTGDICAVGWQLFPLDNYERAFIEDWYESALGHRAFTRPQRGIVGPVFYTTRETLDTLDRAGLLPPVPTTREEQSATERAWAYAFHLAGVPLAGEPFVPNEIPAKVTEYGPLRKVWMH